MRKSESILIVLLLINLSSCGLDLFLYPSANSQDRVQVYNNGSLQNNFKDKTFENQLSCSAGGLYILERKQADNQAFAMLLSNIQFTYVNFTCTINTQPCPILTSLMDFSAIFNLSCPANPNNDDYYNKIDVALYSYTPNETVYEFSFMIDCDEGNRHKKFEIGYAIIAAGNLLLIVGVALHSRFWSYKWKGTQLGIEATWLRVLILVLVFVGLVITLVEVGGINEAATVIGLVLGPIFLMMCLNELYFLSKPMRKPVMGPIRLCDIASFLSALTILIVAVIQRDFITNAILAGGIIIGCIKLFKFTSLKQAALCCAILMIVETSTAVIFHETSPDQSYNDVFGRDIVSPFLIQLPSLTKSLYKKCSWVAVTQIIFPGMTISYLRRFQFARQGRRPYLFTSNFAFFISTIVWLFLQAFYAHTLPFALVTYPVTFLSIIILSHFCMNEFRIIWLGTWEDPEFKHNEAYKGLLRPEEKTSIVMDDDLLDGMHASGIKSSSASQDGVITTRARATIDEIQAKDTNK